MGKDQLTQGQNLRDEVGRVRTFKNTEKHTNGNQAVIVAGPSGSDGECAPGDRGSRH